LQSPFTPHLAGTAQPVAQAVRNPRARQDTRRLTGTVRPTRSAHISRLPQAAGRGAWPP